jgi:hypothetical protein
MLLSTVEFSIYTLLESYTARAARAEHREWSDRNQNAPKLGSEAGQHDTRSQCPTAVSQWVPNLRITQLVTPIEIAFSSQIVCHGVSDLMIFALIAL